MGILFFHWHGFFDEEVLVCVRAGWKVVAGEAEEVDDGCVGPFFYPVAEGCGRCFWVLDGEVVGIVAGEDEIYWLLVRVLFVLFYACCVYHGDEAMALKARPVLGLISSTTC